jgi:hypothetical protein
MRILLGWTVAVAAGAAFVAHAPAPPAFGKDPKPQKEAAEAVRWRRTYAEALWESRLRNVPVLVSRHKDG